MREEDVEPFRQKINEICTLTEDDLQEKIHIDVPMPVSYVSFRLVEELELLEPFGTGNSKPVFAQKDLKFVSARALGKAGNVLRFTVEDSEQKRWEMMYFGGKDNFEAYADRLRWTDCTAEKAVLCILTSCIIRASIPGREIRSCSL